MKHVAYLQDGGYGAVMECVVPVDASEDEIRKHFPGIAARQNPGKAIQGAYGDNSITEIHEPGENPDGECPLCKKALAAMGKGE